MFFFLNILCFWDLVTIYHVYILILLINFELIE